MRRILSFGAIPVTYGRVMSIAESLGAAGRDGWLLFTTRFIRLFAYGALSVVLVLYLVEVG